MKETQLDIVQSLYPEQNHQKLLQSFAERAVDLQLADQDIKSITVSFPKNMEEKVCIFVIFFDGKIKTYTPDYCGGWVESED